MSFPFIGKGSSMPIFHGEPVETSTFNSPFIGKGLERRDALRLLALVMTVRQVCIWSGEKAKGKGLMGHSWSQENPGLKESSFSVGCVSGLHLIFHWKKHLNDRTLSKFI